MEYQMTIYRLCVKCGVHEAEEQAEVCRFCLPSDEDFVEAEVDVETQMRRAVGRRISEGFEMMDDC